MAAAKGEKPEPAYVEQTAQIQGNRYGPATPGTGGHPIVEGAGIAVRHLAGVVGHSKASVNRGGNMGPAIPRQTSERNILPRLHEKGPQDSPRKGLFVEALLFREIAPLQLVVIHLG